MIISLLLLWFQWFISTLDNFITVCRIYFWTLIHITKILVINFHTHIAKNIIFYTFVFAQLGFIIYMLGSLTIHIIQYDEYNIPDSWPPAEVKAVKEDKTPEMPNFFYFLFYNIKKFCIEIYSLFKALIRRIIRVIKYEWHSSKKIIIGTWDIVKRVFWDEFLEWRETERQKQINKKEKK